MNDPALAIAVLIEAGIDKIAYIDIDAHHPDGVEAHFSDDERIRLFSVHESRWREPARKVILRAVLRKFHFAARGR